MATKIKKHLVNPQYKRTSHWLQKTKNGSPYLYILVLAKYSTEYLAYYVYVHICISNQVTEPFYRCAKK